MGLISNIASKPVRLVYGLYQSTKNYIWPYDRHTNSIIFRPVRIFYLLYPQLSAHPYVRLSVS
jgi:hypothetical protein